MYPLILSAVMTCTIYLLHARAKCKQKAYVYLLLFIGLAAVDYLVDYTWQAQASEYDLRTHFLMQAEQDKSNNKKKTRREVYEDYLKVCEEKQEYHREQCMKCYEHAEKLCTFLPNFDDREKALLCLKSAFAAAVPTTPTYRILAVALLALEQYFTDRIMDWQIIDSKLNQAKMHAEMYEHYRLIRKHLKEKIALEPKPTIKFIVE